MYGKWREAPLHQAARWDRGEIVTLLLDRGADIDAPDSNGANPLWYANERCRNAVSAALSNTHGRCALLLLRAVPEDGEFGPLRAGAVAAGPDAPASQRPMARRS